MRELAAFLPDITITFMQTQGKSELLCQTQAMMLTTDKLPWTRRDIPGISVLSILGLEAAEAIWRIALAGQDSWFEYTPLVLHRLSLVEPQWYRMQTILSHLERREKQSCVKQQRNIENQIKHCLLLSKVVSTNFLELPWISRIHNEKATTKTIKGKETKNMIMSRPYHCTASSG